MIWSCQIDYSGWEDDIHHHHFFIKSRRKPSEIEVANHYNTTRYNPEDSRYDELLIKNTPSEYDDSEWKAVEINDDGSTYEYDARITITKLEVEEFNYRREKDGK